MTKVTICDWCKTPLEEGEDSYPFTIINAKDRYSNRVKIQLDHHSKCYDKAKKFFEKITGRKFKC